MNKVVIVVNNFTWYGKRPFRTWLPAIPILTALLKNEFDLQVIDGNVNNYDFDQMASEVKKSNADLVLISALSVDYQRQYHRLAEISKMALPDCKVMMGGVYPSVLAEQVMEDENVDFVMIGHAEERIAKVVRYILENDDNIYKAPGICFRKDGHVRINPLKQKLYMVKKMVRHDYSLLDIEKYFELQQNYSAKNYSTECSEKRSVNIISSYGCPYNCCFCANHSLSDSHVVYRPVKDVLDEIDFFVRKYGVKQVSFMDDNIVADKSRAKELIGGIIDLGYNLEIQIGNLAAWDLNDEILIMLKKAGCSRIGISVESGSQRVLSKIMHKPLNLEIIPPLVKRFKELDIMLIADFLVGIPGETWEEIRSTFDYAYKMGADLCNINIAVPYPGTEMYKDMKANNLLPDDFSFKKNFYVSGLAKTEEFCPSELIILQGFEWERINADTQEKRERVKRVLRLTDEELDEYIRDMRTSALRFVKSYY